MDKLFSSFLNVFLNVVLILFLVLFSVFMVHHVHASPPGLFASGAKAEQENAIQEKQVIESVEKGSTAELPETGAGMKPGDESSDCE